MSKSLVLFLFFSFNFIFSDFDLKKLKPPANPIKKLEEANKHVIKKGKETTNHVRRDLKNGAKTLSNFAQGKPWKTYIRFLNNQANGRKKRLPNWFIKKIQNYYRDINLAKVQYAEGINLGTGDLQDAVTIGYDIFFRGHITWTEEKDRRLMLHELAHAVQYKKAGGIDNFMKRYFYEASQTTFENSNNIHKIKITSTHRFRDSISGLIDIHGNMTLEKNAEGKAKYVMRDLQRQNNINQQTSKNQHNKSFIYIHNPTNERIYVILGYQPPGKRPIQQGFVIHPSKNLRVTRETGKYVYYYAFNRINSLIWQGNSPGRIKNVKTLFQRFAKEIKSPKTNQVVRFKKLFIPNTRGLQIVLHPNTATSSNKFQPTNRHYNQHHVQTQTPIQRQTQRQETEEERQLRIALQGTAKIVEAVGNQIDQSIQRYNTDHQYQENPSSNAPLHVKRDIRKRSTYYNSFYLEFKNLRFRDVVVTLRSPDVFGGKKMKVIVPAQGKKFLSMKGKFLSFRKVYFMAQEKGNGKKWMQFVRKPLTSKKKKSLTISFR
ncbi:eCIS core domain-containing protein [Candidatus Uabimicrobium amorphum]|nr:DUF4157 domain-containing protein [Candidatus Uabimicrobium amorphum]